MSFDFCCSNCGVVLEAEDEWGGMKTQCPECNAEITITKQENTTVQADVPTAHQEQKPVQAVPVQAVPVQAVPVQAAPVQAVPVQAVPVQAVPVQAVPVQAVPVQAQTMPPQQPPPPTPPWGTTGAVPPAGFPQAQTSGKFKINNLTDNANLKVLESKGCFTVYEHQMDKSVNAINAIDAYFMQKMNVRKRQVLAKLDGSTIKMQAGALQWLCGNITSETGLGSGIQAVGGFLKNTLKGMVTGESAVKPLYYGHGVVMLEPTYKHIMLEDISTWGPQGIVLQDGLFLACDAALQERVVSRQTLSSLAAGEGLFNLCLSGNGIAVFESPVPREELIEIELENDILKIDGNMAIAWSSSLQLTVERSSKTLIGSMVNQEGLLNVYRGTGKVWMTPTVQGTLMANGVPDNASASAGSKASKSILGATLDMLTDD